MGLVFIQKPDVLLLFESVHGVLSAQIDAPLTMIVEQHSEIVGQASHFADKFGLSVDPLKQVPQIALAVLRHVRVGQLLLLRHSARRLLNLLHLDFVLDWLQIEVHVVVWGALDCLFWIHCSMCY